MLRVHFLFTFLVFSSTYCAGIAAAMEVFPKESIARFLSNYCMECHSADTPEGDLDLSTYAENGFSSSDVEVWTDVVGKLKFDEMPPEDAEQPSRRARQQVADSIEKALVAAGHPTPWRHKLLFPEYGNLVDHEQLFDGTVDAAAYTPSRLWKRSPHIFDSLVARGMGLGQGRYGRPSAHLAKVKQPFTIEDKSGLKDFAAITLADSATLATMMRNAEVLVDKHLGGALYELQVQQHGPTPEDELPKDKKGKPIRPRHPKTPAPFATIVLTAGPPSDQQIDAALAHMFDLVIQSEPSVDELTKYRGLMRRCLSSGSNAEALRTTLLAIAISPAAIYRLELGQGIPDKHGRRLLGPVELAFSVSYALTDEEPDPTLFQAAKDGNLKTRDDVIREVERIWDDDAIAKPRILRFFHEFFGYHRAPQVFKDDARFGRSYDRAQVPQMLVEDCDQLVLHIVRQDKDVLAKLLTTDRYFIAHPGDNEVARARHESIQRFYEYLKDKGWADWEYATPQEHAEHVRKIDRMFAHPNGNVVKGWMRYLTKCDTNGITPLPMMNRHEFLAAYGLDTKTFNYPVEQPFVLAGEQRVGVLMHPAWFDCSLLEP